jgi:hypothetical protein
MTNWEMFRDRLPIALLLVAILVCLSIWLAPIVLRAQLITTQTGSYQLDTGPTVYWWLDEDRALLCEAISVNGRGSGITGLSCLPLSQTVSDGACTGKPSEVQ